MSVTPSDVESHRHLLRHLCSVAAVTRTEGQNDLFSGMSMPVCGILNTLPVRLEPFGREPFGRYCSSPHPANSPA